MKHLLVQFALVVVTLTSGEPKSVTKYAGWTSFGAYEPRNPKSLSEISYPIREKVLVHLKRRLGESFFAKLKFSGGQIVDRAALLAKNPDARDYQWEVHAYDLHFDFQMPETGIASYTAQIQLRADGTVISDIDLPNFRLHPEKEKIISLRSALEIAKRNGFNLEKLRVEIIYVPKVDSLVWSFSEVTKDNGLSMKIKNIHISAHTSKVIAIFSNGAIR